MKTPQQIKEYLALHPGITDTSAANNLRRHGVTAAQVRAARGGPASLPPTPRQAIGKPVADLIEQFDDVAKVRRAMTALPCNSYVDDEEMRRHCSVPSPRWRSVAAHSTLADFRFQLPNKRTVWMHPQKQIELKRAIAIDDVV